MNLGYALRYILLPVFVAGWDIAVVVEDEMQFFQEGRLLGTAGDNLKELLSATYDPVRGDLFVSDNNQQNASIFRINMLSPVEESFTPVVRKQAYGVQGIVFDAVSSTLFWCTGYGRTIHKLTYTDNVRSTIKDNSKLPPPMEGDIIHEFSDEIPQGIAVDSCEQILYWTNCNHLKPSIERSAIDGSKREVIIRDRLFQPLGIAVDLQTKKIFWSDEREGMYYSIERSNLDGTKREILIHGAYHQPFSVAVASDHVYWSDWINNAVWSLSKDNVNGGEEPVQMIKTLHHKCPLGITSNVAYNLDAVDCPAMVPLKHKIKESMSRWKVPTIKPTSRAKKENATSNLVNLQMCLNSGTMLDGKCVCKNGYTGLQCEMSSCHNYCIANGTCTVNKKGYPECTCSWNRKGERCEHDICAETCFNNGTCIFVENKGIKCVCEQGYTGDKCEIGTHAVDELCRAYCIFIAPHQVYPSVVSSDNHVVITKRDLDSDLLHLCGTCSKYKDIDQYNVQLPKQVQVSKQYDATGVVVTSVLIAACVILAVLVIYLSVKIYRLKRRPRIKKRIIVNKPSPFSCRSRPATDQCEITIENCCNMNICETPCFEPEFPASKATFTKNKSEDKRILIGRSKNSLSSQDEEVF